MNIMGGGEVWSGGAKWAGHLLKPSAMTITMGTQAHRWHLLTPNHILSPSDTPFRLPHPHCTDSAIFKQRVEKGSNSSIQDRYHIILYAHFEEFPNCGQNLVSPKMTEPALVPAICAAHTNGAAKVLGNRRPTLPRDQSLGQYHFTPQLLTIFRHLFIVQSICFKHLFARLLLWIDIFELRMTRQFQMMRLCD